MKRIFYLYRDMTQMLGKFRLYIKPAEFEDALEWASRSLFDEYYGNTAHYRPGHPLPAVAYQLTTAVSDALHPFLRETAWAAADLLDLPADWVHPTSFDVAGAEEAVQVLDDNEVRATLTSHICAPDEAHPMLEVVPGGYRPHPAGLDWTAKYLGQPRRAVYATRFADDDPDAEPEYDDDNSVDVEWPASRDNQLLTRLLQYPALGLRDNLVQQVAQGLTEKGA